LRLAAQLLLRRFDLLDECHVAAGLPRRPHTLSIGRQPALNIEQPAFQGLELLASRETFAVDNVLWVIELGGRVFPSLPRVDGANLSHLELPGERTLSFLTPSAKATGSKSQGQIAPSAAARLGRGRRLTHFASFFCRLCHSRHANALVDN
jgi:hypothetical protein